MVVVCLTKRQQATEPDVEFQIDSVMTTKNGSSSDPRTQEMVPEKNQPVVWKEAQHLPMPHLEQLDCSQFG